VISSYHFQDYSNLKTMMTGYISAIVGTSISAIYVRHYLSMLDTNGKLSIAIFGVGCTASCFWYCAKYATLVHKTKLKSMKNKPIEVLFFPDEISLESDIIAATTQMRAVMYDESLNNFSIADNESSLDRLLHYIDKATKSIDLCLFLFTSEPLTNCIIQKMEQGIKVRIIADGTTIDSPDSKVSKCQEAGANVSSSWNQTTPAEFGLINGDLLMHNKFAVIDNSTVITGSFNWTYSATIKNNENIIITSRNDIVHPYVKEYERIWGKCNHS